MLLSLNDTGVLRSYSVQPLQSVTQIAHDTTFQQVMSLDSAARSMVRFFRTRTSSQPLPVTLAESSPNYVIAFEEGKGDALFADRYTPVPAVVILLRDGPNTSLIERS